MLGWKAFAAGLPLPLAEAICKDVAAALSAAGTTQGTATTALTIKVMVSAAGVVTFQTDAAVPGTLAAPTAIGTSPTLDNGDPYIPFVHYLNSADLCDSVVIQSWEVGYTA